MNTAAYLSFKAQMNQTSSLSRRRFLQRTATLAGVAAGVQYAVFSSLLGAESPNSKLGVAVIAADGMGGYSFDSAMRERFVAVCDVDDNKLSSLRLRSGPRQSSLLGSDGGVLDSVGLLGFAGEGRLTTSVRARAEDLCRDGGLLGTGL